MIYIEKNYLETTEAAVMLNVSSATVRRLFDAGILSGFRIPGGEHRRISLLSVLAFKKSGDIPHPAPKEIPETEA
jgi:excisionase family DNA binding protein